MSKLDEEFGWGTGLGCLPRTQTASCLKGRRASDDMLAAPTVDGHLNVTQYIMSVAFAELMEHETAVLWGHDPRTFRSLAFLVAGQNMGNEYPGDEDVTFMDMLDMSRDPPRRPYFLKNWRYVF